MVHLGKAVLLVVGLWCGISFAQTSSDPTACDRNLSNLADAPDFKVARPGVTDGSSWELYKATDSEDPRFVATGKYKGGSLHFHLRTKLPDGTRSKVLRGSDELRRMLRYFENEGTPIERICGEWSNETTDTDNLDEFNRLTKPPHGLKPAEAAMRTWTGKQAAAHGFPYADVVRVSGEPGLHDYVKVYYVKDPPR